MLVWRKRDGVVVWKNCAGGCVGEEHFEGLIFSLLLNAPDGDCQPCFDSDGGPRGCVGDANFGAMLREKGESIMRRSCVAWNGFGDLESPIVVASTIPLSHVSISERHASFASG